jgi:2-polyprenyl-3-methyl-5-hydroxy-6-metoxy-1,4-benzoquinol methylase
MGLLREFVAKLYFTSPLARSILRRLGFQSEVEKELPQPRSIEYFWVIKNLDLDKGKILDVGSVGSILPFKLACLGYEVYSIDVQELLQLKIVHQPNLKFTRGDIRHTNFPNNFLTE